ncbi:MAG: branched-chain amino acid ABC transporter permease [Eubacteriales bacterium]|nr:branched-chain amino acid ABC transporter permease [Eubacteriales bacterium]
MTMRKKSNIKFKYFVNYLLVALALIICIVLGQNGMLSRSAMTLLPRIAYSIILAVSLNLVVGFLGELSLGHAGFMCVGAYIGCYFANYLHTVLQSNLLILVLSMLCGGLVAALFGFIIGLPALRLKGDYLAIVTLAFGEIVRNVFKNLPFFGGAMGLKTTKYPSSSLYIVAFSVVLVVLFLIQNLIRSKHGRAITAIRDNEIAARAMGINVTYYKIAVFVLAAFFAGLAGVLYGHLNTPILYTFFSYNYSIEILVMVVLGGMGSVTGSIVAATLITYVNFLLQSKLSGDLAAIRLLVYALILIVAVLYNNAPALRPLREKLNLKRLGAKLFSRRTRPETVRDDDAAWDRIDTKIKMDELLSVELRADPQEPDKPDKTQQEKETT